MLFNFGATPSRAETFSGESLKEGVKIPKLEQKNLSYTGVEQSPEFEYDSSKVNIVSGGSGTNAGAYTAVFSLIDKNKYIWEDFTSEDKEIEWYIGMEVIAAVPYQIGNLVYNGNEQGPTWNNYNQSLMNISGVTTSVNAGDYVAKFTPNENALWWDGTRETKSSNWTMSKAVVYEVPSQDGTLTYTGSAISPAWNNYSDIYFDIGGDVSGIDAGDYTATFTPNKNTTWEDGSNVSKSAVWSISKASVAIPTISGTYTYTGEEIVPTVNYESDKVVLAGDASATNVGTYNIIASLKNNNYIWEDNTIEDKTLTWSIIAHIKIPTQSNFLTYTGNALEPTWNNYDENQLTIGGVTSAIDAGNYEATFTPKEGYSWEDGSTTEKTSKWLIDRATISFVPSQSGILIYTGNEQTPTWNNYNPEELIIEGATSGTNAGVYYVTFTPTKNYKWYTEERRWSKDELSIMTSIELDEILI